MGRLFSSLGELIWKNRIKLLIILVILIILIIIIKKISKIIQKKKELRRAAADRTRDEKLNSFILNSSPSSDGKNVYVPYEVDYSKGAQNADNKAAPADQPSGVIVQIIEQTGLSMRKFALNASKGIHIGTASDNDISFISDDRNEYSCELFEVRGSVFVRNTGKGSQIVLKRKKKQVIVDNRGIEINSGDKLIMASYSYAVTIVK